MEILAGALVAIGAALIGSLSVGLITSADALRASRRDVYGRFLVAAYDHIAAMDQQAASRSAELDDPGLGKSEELARLVRVIELVGPPRAWAAAWALYSNIGTLDAKLGEYQTYPKGFEDVWANQVKDRNFLLDQFRGVALSASRSFSEDVRTWFAGPLRRG